MAEGTQSQPTFSVRKHLDTIAKQHVLRDQKEHSEAMEKYLALAKKQENIPITFDKDINAHNEAIEQLMAKREEEAKNFCQNKSVEELKEYLANQPIPYNLWKDASYKNLIALVSEMYYDDA